MKWVKNDGQWDRVTVLGSDESICTEVYPVGSGRWKTITWFVRPDNEDGTSNFQSLTLTGVPDIFRRTMLRANEDHDAAVKRFTIWRDAQPEPTELDRIKGQLGI